MTGRTCALGLAGVAVLTSTPSHGQFDAQDWDFSGCASTRGDQLDLAVCQPGSCSSFYSEARFRPDLTGVYTFDVAYEVAHDCCVLLTVTGGFTEGGFSASPWCGSTPCTGTLADVSVYLEAGELARFTLSAAAIECASGFLASTSVTFTDLEFDPVLPTPEIQSVEGAQSFGLEQSALFGNFLVEPLTVQLDGRPVAHESFGPGSLLFEVPLVEPGFHDVSVTTAAGSTLAADAFEAWPSLRAERVAPTLVELELDARVSFGSYLVALGLGSFAAPLDLGPLYYFGLQLDPAAFWLIVGVGDLTSSAPITLSVPLPGDPGLRGLELWFQALSSTFVGDWSHAYSFSNLSRLVL